MFIDELDECQCENPILRLLPDGDSVCILCGGTAREPEDDEFETDEDDDDWYG